MAGHGARLDSAVNGQFLDQDFVFPLSSQQVNGWRRFLISLSPFGGSSNRRTFSTYARRLLINEAESRNLERFPFPAVVGRSRLNSVLGRRSQPVLGTPTYTHNPNLRFSRSNSNNFSSADENTVINIDTHGDVAVHRTNSNDDDHSRNDGSSASSQEFIANSNSSTGSLSSNNDLPQEETNNEINSSENNEMFSEILARYPEVINLWKVIWQYFVFVLIVVLKLIYDRFSSLITVINFTSFFLVCNTIVKKYLANRERISAKYAFSISAVLILIPSSLYLFYHHSTQRIYYTALLLPSESQELLSLGDLLWIVVVTDLLLKLVTVYIKCVYSVIPGCIIRYRSKGKHMALIEYTSQLYRSLAPIQPWLAFLLDNYVGIQKVFGVFLSALYMLCKGTDILDKIRNFFNVLKNFCQSGYGAAPTKSQLKDCGSTCPICQDDYSQPIRLSCEHIFCESCVARWFDRERTCPMCRTQIADDPSYKDGSTTYCLQLY